MRATRFVVWAILLVPATSFAAERPGPLPDEAGCQHYRGSSSGNDPSVRLDVVLCSHPDGAAGHVLGKLQWSSLLTGWNVRKVEGRWSGETLTLRDLDIIEERPEPGFRFCIIDPYVLTQDSGGGLSGKYDSEDCDDHAEVNLQPVATKPATPRSEPAPPAAPAKAEPPKEPAAADPTPPTPSKSRGESSSGGCGCDVSLLACLPIVGLRRRRRVTRARRPSPARRA